ncbi:MAG: tyrosine--tRNA ligase [Bacteroidales bacterium]|nr:tyrosine--tRNA ligase [Bacteroidales bacterium]
MGNAFIEELRWRGMIHDMTPGLEEQLSNEMTTAYVGIDPTADSLHIGHLVSIMMLKHLQKHGHKPIALIGGATGMIGDPSGKSEERKLLDEHILRHNETALYEQLKRFLDFDTSKPNGAEIVNNYDWTKDFSLIQFLREVGKHITVNYMLAKDSVKKRMETGISFTEFTYQLLQGYDFLYLYEHKNCKLQMGGSDQWGNITTGTELIRRKLGAEAFALTCPLITKADGGKFGKTEKGNVWLDKRYTTPYQFYQFWINTTDEDAERYIKIFTMLSKEEIETLIEQHRKEPHLRMLQQTLAREVTIMVHGEQEYQSAVEASQILFGKGTKELLERLDEQTFLSVFDGVPQYHLTKESLQSGISIVDFLAVTTDIMPSKSEARKMIASGAISINKEKVQSADIIIDTTFCLNSKYILIQKGKKNYYLIVLT